MRYKVIRDCCHGFSHCVDCEPGRKRKRVIQLNGLTKEKAEQVAKNWASYNAKVFPEIEEEVI